MDLKSIKNQPENKESSDESDTTLEYKSLRNEIAHNDTSGLQLFAASLIIVAAIMGFALKGSASPLLKIGSFCAIVGIVCIIIRQTIDRIRMTFIIAAYLRYFVEPKLKDVKWETRLNVFRKIAPKIAFDRQNNMLTIYKYMGSLNMILAITYFLQLLNTFQEKSFNISLGNKSYFSLSNLYIALLGILFSLLLLIYTWIDTSKKMKRYITKNEKFVEHQWIEVARHLQNKAETEKEMAIFDLLRSAKKHKPLFKKISWISHSSKT